MGDKLILGFGRALCTAAGRIRAAGRFSDRDREEWHPIYPQVGRALPLKSRQPPLEGGNEMLIGTVPSRYSNAPRRAPAFARNRVRRRAEPRASPCS